ncbi:acyl-CoA dehydrogenase family protein [uncultured Eubacterium sp.]|uniref:acyl-CoA dehydrogenase family protein n=1 Tax=uncultured Eubacterium sp. TaxID=165185 RepID=UPI0015A78365|nr:acyl-CoA dehydrogenase family protein [uncultured Eubacterium sp.]
MVRYLFATEEQKKMYEEVSAIMEEALPFEKLKEIEASNGGVGEYPWDVHKKLADAGYYAMNLPKEYGGKGIGWVTRALVFEAISYTDAGFAFSFRGLGDKFDTVQNSHLPEEEKQAWAAKFRTGEAGGAFALTEPNAGSDAKAIEATAVKDGNEWVINGTKCMINNAGTADYFGVFAWTDKSVGAGHGITCFLVEKDRPGVVIPPADNKLGMKLENCGSIEFHDVRVPEDHIVGELGRGFATAMDKLEAVRPFNIAFALGAAQRSVDECVKYANDRMAFGKTIINHEGVGFQLAEMQLKLDAARCMLYETMEAADRGIKLGYLASGAKWYGIELCVQVANDALDIMGGRGIMHDYPLEKIMRDLRGLPAMGGTPLIQKRTIARTMIKRDK